MKSWTKKEWLVSWILNIYIVFFLFVFFWSKLQESEKKNLELLTDIERLKKETEELRSEKGMANDIQINKNVFHIGGYILSIKCHLANKIRYQGILVYHMWAHLLHDEMYPQQFAICTSHMYPFCWYTWKSKVLSGL